MLRKTICLLLGVCVATTPLTGVTQSDSPALNLPRLGDADGDTLSPADERRLGESIMRDIRRDAAMVDDPEATDYLAALGARLARARAARSAELEFFLVNDNSLNAFALPGGFIGVHTGLIARAQSESELASVLGHEIGHVVQRHIARMLEKNRQSSLVALAAMVVGLLAVRSNPNAAGGVMALGQGIQQDQMLAFSRDAEREADRIGLDILRESGMNPGDMVVFFQRMQSATAVYESGAPVYLRTHPLTTERIADVQNRLREGRYRQHADTFEFQLLRAKLRALAERDVDGLAAARATLERHLRERSFVDESAAWYGLAVTAREQGDWSTLERALWQARRTHAGTHPWFDRLEIDALMQRDRLDAALARSRAAIARAPGSRPLALQHAELLIRAQRHSDAIAYLEPLLAAVRGDPALWQLMAQAQFGAGRAGLGHRAAAEQYALGGGLLAAIEQLRLAQRDQGLDFYTASQIDARLRELQARYTREMREGGLR